MNAIIPQHYKMTIPRFTKAQNLNVSSLKFSSVKIGDNQSKKVFVNSDTTKIILQTPKMYVPNGIKRWRKENAIDNKDDAFELELSFGGDSEDIQKFHENMKHYDELVKKEVQANSLEWIGKPKVSMETIEDAFYTPVVKIAVDKNKQPLDYPDRIKLKIDRQRDSRGNFTGEFVSSKANDTPVSVYDTNKNQLTFNEDNYDRVISKGCYVICLIELVYISITAKVSTKWKLVQVKLFKENNKIEGYAIDDEDEDNDIEKELQEKMENLEFEEALEEKENDADNDESLPEEAVPEPEEIEIVPEVKKTRKRLPKN